MPGPFVITIEDDALEAALGHALRPETGAALRAGRLEEHESGGALHVHIALPTIESLRELQGVYWSLIQAQNTPAAASCGRALFAVEIALQAFDR